MGPLLSNPVSTKDRSAAGGSPIKVIDTQPVSTATADAVPRARTKGSFASRLFGYDIFLSFALGPAPRGALSYASDLARHLRERDFSVFFSEQEAPPGEQLNNVLRAALHRSKTLVVIANRGTLREPRWVRKQVEEFRQYHPERPVVIINVDRALQDPGLAESALTRALTGDTQGAIADFSSFVDWCTREQKCGNQSSKREQWIKLLQSGVNPFDAETLDALRKE